MELNFPGMLREIAEPLTVESYKMGFVHGLYNNAYLEAIGNLEQEADIHDVFRMRTQAWFHEQLYPALAELPVYRVGTWDDLRQNPQDLVKIMEDLPPVEGLLFTDINQRRVYDLFYRGHFVLEEELMTQPGKAIYLTHIPPEHQSRFYCITESYIVINARFERQSHTLGYVSPSDPIHRVRYWAQVQMPTIKLDGFAIEVLDLAAYETPKRILAQGNLAGLSADQQAKYWETVETQKKTLPNGYELI